MTVTRCRGVYRSRNIMLEFGEFVTETVALDLQVAPGSPSWLRLARLAKLLASLTLVWLGIEGAVGVIAGILPRISPL